MEAMISHLDLTQIFCEVDDFCQRFERQWQQQAQLPELEWYPTKPNPDVLERGHDDCDWVPRFEISHL